MDGNHPTVGMRFGLFVFQHRFRGLPGRKEILEAEHTITHIDYLRLCCGSSALCVLENN